jgi:hypothetical protein
LANVDMAQRIDEDGFDRAFALAEAIEVAQGDDDPEG